MFYFDRLYGEMRFPPIVRDTLDCPGLLRLREVRMANIPFLRFPSFTGVTRYEHSLGVCYLAGIFAEATGLNDKDKIEVMLAALYHDAATPPFGHAVEEVLAGLFGYNHEEQLRGLIIGKTNDLGGKHAQLFLGRSLKLHKICQSRLGHKLGLDILRIADLAAGIPDDRLGDVICSSGIDLDNIDNVVRSASAMGIRECNPSIAESLAKSFIFHKNRVCIDEAALHYLDSWKQARNNLYGMIYSSIDDFSLQTMLKHSLRKLKEFSEQPLLETDWSLTDDELIHQRLMKCPAANEIVKRMRLGDVYTCLAFLKIEPNEQGMKINKSIGNIEEDARSVYSKYIDRTLKPHHKDSMAPEIISNIYLDKRHRSTGRPTCFMGRQHLPEEETRPSQWILGVFTPHHRKWDQEAERTFHALLATKYNVKNLRLVRKGEGRYPNIEEVQG
jgi:uncharacterized protein